MITINAQAPQAGLLASTLKRTDTCIPTLPTYIYTWVLTETAYGRIESNLRFPSIALLDYCHATLCHMLLLHFIASLSKHDFSLLLLLLHIPSHLKIKGRSCTV